VLYVPREFFANSRIQEIVSLLRRRSPNLKNASLLSTDGCANLGLYAVEQLFDTYECGSKTIPATLRPEDSAAEHFT